MSKPRDFKVDLKKSNDPKLRTSWEKIIKKKFSGNTTIIWKDGLDIQKGLGTDVVIKTDKGRRYSVELKTRIHTCYKNPDYVMEITHHGYTEENPDRRKKVYTKPGWIYTTTAEYLFHATLTEKGTGISEVIFYSLRPFKDEIYKSEFKKYNIKWWPTLFENGIFQLTLNRLIPKEIIKRDSEVFWEWKQ
jgi:hypothetical protein